MLRHSFPTLSENSLALGGGQHNNAIVPSFCNNGLREYSVKITHGRGVINGTLPAPNSFLRSAYERVTQRSACIAGNSSSRNFSGSANPRASIGATVGARSGASSSQATALILLTAGLIAAASCLYCLHVELSAVPPVHFAAEASDV